MPGIYIETYGCQMNVSDSELMLGVLGREGYVRMDDPAQADVVLVNTCAVRDHAEQKVLSRMGELKRLKRPGSVLGVVGCMAQRLGPRLLDRSEEHTSELQSRLHLVCRLLLEKKKNTYTLSECTAQDHVLT